MNEARTEQPASPNDQCHTCTPVDIGLPDPHCLCRHANTPGVGRPTVAVRPTVHDQAITNATPTEEADTMNRNTDDKKNTNDTQGHAVKPQGVDETDAEGNGWRGFVGDAETDEADTDGHAAKFRPEDKTDEADTEGHAGRFRP